MRLTLTTTLAAAALAFPQLAPSYAHAQPARLRPPPQWSRPKISVFPMRRGSFRWDQEKFLRNAVIPF